MDDKTIALVDKLASRLGTTSQYLWSVLVKQAMISGIVDLCIYIVVIFILYKSYWFIHRNTLIPPPSEDERYPEANWSDSGNRFFAWFIYAILFVASVLLIIFSLEKVSSAFLNPEYWALQELIDHIK